MSDLSIKSPTGVLRTYKLKGTNILGRLTDCDLVLDDQFVSRKHCRIEQESDGNYYIENLSTSGGTFVNGDRLVERAKLKSGDSIKLGDFDLTFTVHAHSTTFGRRLTQSAFEAMRQEMNRRIAKGA